MVRFLILLFIALPALRRAVSKVKFRPETEA
jgi:hypothetical protein